MERINPFSVLPPKRIMSDEEVAAYHARQEQQQWRDARERIGVPYDFRDASFDGAVETSAMAAVRQYMAADYAKGRSLWLMGSNGLGKSYAAAAALREAGRDNQHRIGRRFFDFTMLCNDLMSYNDDVLRAACETWFVVFDEFGRDDGVAYIKKGGVLEPKIEVIIRAREANRRPTIFTTNMSKDDIATVFSERVRSRLGRGWGHVENCSGEDLRNKP